MGVEGLQGTPLGDYPDKAAAKAAATESLTPTETIIDRKEIKIFPQLDGSFNVYVDGCPFIVEISDSGLSANYDATNERNFAWKAPNLKHIAIQAVNENYLQ